MIWFHVLNKDWLIDWLIAWEESAGNWIVMQNYTKEVRATKVFRARTGGSSSLWTGIPKLPVASTPPPPLFIIRTPCTPSTVQEPPRPSLPPPPTPVQYKNWPYSLRVHYRDPLYPPPVQHKNPLDLPNLCTPPIQYIRTPCAPPSSSKDRYIINFWYIHT